MVGEDGRWLVRTVHTWLLHSSSLTLALTLTLTLAPALALALY